MSVTLASGRERGQGIFAHDTEVALAGAAALVNTGRGGTEQLPDVAALDRYVAEWELTGVRTRDQAELDGVRRMRAQLERLWELDKDGAAELVNALLRDGNALPQLVKHGGWDYHLHATPPDAPLADRLAVDTAMAFADVIRTGQLERLRLCAAADCDNVHVDLSKNRSRRFCGTACANRVNVAAYRTRQARTRQTERRGTVVRLPSWEELFAEGRHAGRDRGVVRDCRRAGRAGGPDQQAADPAAAPGRGLRVGDCRPGAGVGRARIELRPVRAAGRPRS